MAGSGSRKRPADPGSAPSSTPMAKKGRSAASASSENKPKNLNWKADKGALLFQLVNLVEREENWVIFGGKDTSNVEDGGSGRHKTTKDSKIDAFRRIAREMIPDRCSTAPETTKAANTLKSKWDDHVDIYKKSISELSGTGAGLTDEGDTFYMPETGPDDQTPSRIKNLWDQMHEKSPIFGRLHSLFALKPKAVPPSITTGISPNGIEIRHLQEPSQATLDIEATYVKSGASKPTSPQDTRPPSPALSDISTPRSEAEPVLDEPASRSTTGPRLLQDVIKKHQESDTPSKKKSKSVASSYESGLLKMAAESMEVNKNRAREESLFRHEQLKMQRQVNTREERAELRKDFDAGLVSIDEYRVAVQKLDLRRELDDGLISRDEYRTSLQKLLPLLVLTQPSP